MELPAEVRRDVERLNAQLRSQRTLATKLEAVAALVQRAVPGCDAVSVSLTVEEAMFTGAASSQLAIEADLVQYAVGEGPCLSSALEHATIRIDALSHDERFVHFAPGAVEMGIESVLSIPLAGAAVVGSINLYSRAERAFGEDVPDRIADHVAYAADLIAASPLYAASVETLARLVEVVHQADQVEIAVGLLIVQRGLSPAEAWDHLRAEATRRGTSIVDHARGLIEAHERGLDPER